ncbi:hypothetical protein M405DRAFT_815431, partial [Rhizopogon salebrosus TDB-379]
VLEIYLATLLVESQDLPLREVLLEALSSVTIAPMHMRHNPASTSYSFCIAITDNFPENSTTSGLVEGLANGPRCVWIMASEVGYVPIPR